MNFAAFNLATPPSLAEAPMRSGMSAHLRTAPLSANAEAETA
jgi:hypothetical protein